MAGETEIAFGLENGIHLDQSFADEIPMTHIVKSGFPEGVLLMLVFEWYRISDVLQEVAIRDG